MSNPQDKKSAFLQLYDPVQKQISNYCRALAGNTDDARDLLQDTLLAALENFGSLRKPESFLFFMCGVAKRIYLKQFRRRKYEGDIAEVNPLLHFHSNTGEANADVQALYNAIALLPLEQREALVMFEIMGFSLKEIHDHQGGSISGVKSRVARAREKLSEMLSEPNADAYVKPSKKATL